MEEILDQPLIEKDKSRVTYAGFWKRLGALVIDFFILLPVTFGLNYFNITNWKSTVVLIVATIIGMGYKPVMEILYGATWGKMAVGIKVINTDFEKADVKEILLRNVFNIIPPLVTMIFTIGLYSTPEFQEISGFMEYSSFTEDVPVIQAINGANFLITIVDAIVLAADSQKRSIHDRIGGTLVVDKYSVD